MKIRSIKTLFFFIALGFLFTPIHVDAQSAQNKKPIKYKKARALQATTAKKMAKVYEAIDRVNEEGEPDPDMQTVLNILNELLADKENLKSYDRSVMWNAWAYVYYTEERYEKAIETYKKLVNEPEVTIGLRLTGLLYLGQLHMIQEVPDYKKTIEYLLQWQGEVEKVTAQSHAILGQAYYESKQYRNSLNSIEKAVDLAEVEGYKPKESWYTLMAAGIEELKDEIGKEKAILRQIDIYEILVNLYPKKDYFLRLGGRYMQLGREKDYMITLKAAHAKDLLNKENEYLTLAQLLLLSKNPYWAAEVITSGQKKMITQVDEKTKEEKIVPVIKNTEKNLKLLGDSWRMAQEIDKAIPVLEESAKLSKKGESYVLLGNLYLSEDKVKKAIDAINKGLKKGGIDNLSQVNLTLGQAHFELQKFEDAKKYFRVAARDKDKKIKTQANNWIKYTENEEVRVKNLAMRRDFIQNSG